MIPFSGVTAMALYGTMTTVLAAVAIGTTSGDLLLSHRAGLYQIFLRHKKGKDPQFFDILIIASTDMATTKPQPIP